MLVESRKLNQTKFDLKHTNLEIVPRTAGDNNKMPVNVTLRLSQRPVYDSVSCGRGKRSHAC